MLQQPSSTVSAYDILISLPFEIRSKIWKDAIPTIATTINCCSCTINTTTTHKQHLSCQQFHAPRSAARSCILPFSTISSNIDPLHVAIFSPKLKTPTTFVFCCTSCLGAAMHLSTPAQLVLLAGSTIRVAMAKGIVNWVLEGGHVPMSVMDTGPLAKRIEMEQRVEEGELDGEERINVLRECMSKNLVGVGRKYFGTGGEKEMRLMWSGRDGGSGWVEMDI